MDIKHVLSRNPLLPAYDASVPAPTEPAGRRRGPSSSRGIAEIGHAGTASASTTSCPATGSTSEPSPSPTSR